MRSVNYFLEVLRKVHGERYTYISGTYKKWVSRVGLVCKRHGPFTTKPLWVKDIKAGCPLCGREASNKAKLKSTEDFIRRARERFGDDVYDYSRSVYVKAKHKLEIGCKRCGQFFSITPNSHLTQGCGCPRCRMSKGELEIVKLLTEWGVQFISQAKLGCINPRTGYNLYFDFFIPSRRLLVEYDGDQHFTRRSVLYTRLPEDKRDAYFEAVRYRDGLKNAWVKRVGYKLERIPYFMRPRMRDVLREVLDKHPRLSDNSNLKEDHMAEKGKTKKSVKKAKR